MKSYRRIDQDTIEITDEEGNTKEWTRSFLVNDQRDVYDFNHQMEIKGTWYVARKPEEIE